jgi:hypothetical protein
VISGTGIKRTRAGPAGVVGTESIVQEGGKFGTSGVILNIIIGGRRVVDSSDTQNDLDTFGPAVGDVVLKRCTVAQQI